MIRQWWHRLKRRIGDDSERGAREAMLQELFNDFNRSRFAVYKFNFFRGIFFGLGSVLGGTIVVALLLWILNITGHLIPGLAGFVNDVIDKIQHGR